MIQHKILFVTCVNDEKLYEKCVKHISKLFVPLNTSLELLPIRGAESMTEGYNQALKNEAKYKVYLHQDTFILNRNFLNEIVNLFRSNPMLGLIGMIGCKRLSPDGVWWKGKDLVGKVVAYHYDTYHLIKMREVETSFEQVEAVDGLLMATQYDIPWRDDLFKGFHFYDTSQCAEFIKKGYLVGVPKQLEPWCFHYDTTDYDPEDYREHQNIFLQNYVGRQTFV